MIVLMIGLSILAGIAHGMGESLDKDPYVFQKIWSVPDVSFFGPLMWKLKYKNHDVKSGFKSLLWKYLPLDFEHLESWVTKAAHIAVGALAFHVFEGPIAIAVCVASYGAMSGIAHFVYEFINARTK